MMKFNERCQLLLTAEEKALFVAYAKSLGLSLGAMFRLAMHERIDRGNGSNGNAQ